MSDRAKVNLFTRGVDCGAKFLKKFDWLGYKRIRADLVKAYQQPQQPL
jgi:hypothetical protein